MPVPPEAFGYMQVVATRLAFVAPPTLAIPTDHRGGNDPSSHDADIAAAMQVDEGSPWDLVFLPSLPAIDTDATADHAAGEENVPHQDTGTASVWPVNRHTHTHTHIHTHTHKP
jgi:hypothetical protein